MKKRYLSVLLSLAVLAGSLIGCGQSQSSEQTTSKVEATESAATTEGDENTLTVWAWDPNFNIYSLKEAEKIYQKENPDFKLVIEEKVYKDIEAILVTAATSGDFSTLPDIFLMQDYSYQKNIANYPEIFTELSDSGIDFTQFTAGKLADSTANGKHYGVPFDNGASIMALRVDLLEEAGLKAEDFKDITWSRFRELADIVKEKTGRPMITTSGGVEIVMQMLQSAAISPMKDGKVDIVNNPGVKQAMETYIDFVKSGYMVEYVDWDQYVKSINDGSVVGVINGCWIMASIQAAEDQSGKWAIVNLPSLDGIEGATNYANNGGSSWAVSSNVKNKELAFDFLKKTFGSSVELYDTILPTAGAVASYIPAGESALYKEPVEFYGGQKVFEDIISFASKVPAFDTGAYLADIRAALTDAETNVVQNGADLDAELAAAQEAVEFKIQ